MVSRPPRSVTPLILVGIAVLSFIACFAISALIAHHEDNQSASSNIDSTPVTAPTNKPDFIDLQSTLDEWINSTPGAKGVIIYDLDHDRVSAQYQPDDIFATASLYKLFPVYTGYTAVEKGQFNSTTKLADGHTISECLDLALRESNSTCAELLVKSIGADQIQQSANEWGTVSTNVSGLQSTPSDIIKVLQKYYHHPELSADTYAKILDSMLNQPVTHSELCDGYCDWRQGLPSGFTDPATKVYNKVGCDYNPDGYWNLYHDAAITEISSNLDDTPHHYAIVVMTSKINPIKLAALGAKIEKKVLDFAHD